MSSKFLVGMKGLHQNKITLILTIYIYIYIYIYIITLYLIVYSILSYSIVCENVKYYVTKPIDIIL